MSPVAHPPSVDAIARSLASTGLPHPVLVDVAREAIASGDADGAASRAAAAARRMLIPVVNATGVLIHTNLGRTPIAHHVDAAYSNLELDLDTGARGSRQERVGSLVARAAGAEAAIVVNNCAAAVLLVLAALAAGERVAVSRGELVEIGGGFRIPDVLATSGALLVEVGTTNRTRLADYAAAAPRLTLKVHPSNYRLSGFIESVPPRALATLDAPLVVDLGSGLLDAATPWLRGGPPSWLEGEPAARQTLADGAAIVTFSGDKLLGGPQAGVIAGRADLVARCAAHPLARALRPGSLVLGALQATMLAYLRRDGDAIPFWRMATTPVDELRARAAALGVGAVVDTASVTGGGTLPGVEIPSAGVAVDGDRLAALRACDPPIIARIDGGRTVCDLRTVDPADDAHVRDALTSATS
jgi:L-seryl-tRNA(Ser) seleniumtransferase